MSAAAARPGGRRAAGEAGDDGHGHGHRFVEEDVRGNGPLAGASTLWVGGVCLASVLVVGAALPAGAEGAGPATGAPKPAGSGEGHKPAAPSDEPPSKRRNG